MNHATRKKRTSSDLSVETRRAWRKPGMTRIEIKRTMIESGSDIDFSEGSL